MRRVGAAIARIKNTEVAKRVAAKAVETKAPAEAVDRTARSRQGTPAKPQPNTQFKIARGTRVVIHGRLI